MQHLLVSEGFVSLNELLNKVSSLLYIKSAILSYISGQRALVTQIHNNVDRIGGLFEFMHFNYIRVIHFVKNSEFCVYFVGVFFIIW